MARTNYVSFKCDRCHFSTRKCDCLVQHTLTSQVEARENYQCEECSYKTSRSYDLKRHMLRRHKATQRNNLRFKEALKELETDTDPERTQHSKCKEVVKSGKVLKLRIGKVHKSEQKQSEESSVPETNSHQYPMLFTSEDQQNNCTAMHREIKEDEWRGIDRSLYKMLGKYFR